MNNDQYFLRVATEEANIDPLVPSFGAVVVKDGKIIAQDHNRTRELNDPSAHAEVCALRKAGQIVQNHNLDGCTLYGSHEPCVMCFSCAAWANISRVVYALPVSDHSEDSYGFKDLSLKEIAAKLSGRKVSTELVRLD